MKVEQFSACRQRLVRVVQNVGSTNAAVRYDWFDPSTARRTWPGSAAPASLQHRHPASLLHYFGENLAVTAAYDADDAQAFRRGEPHDNLFTLRCRPATRPSDKPLHHIRHRSVELTGEDIPRFNRRGPLLALPPAAQAGNVTVEGPGHHCPASGGPRSS